jgi:hypothetical protein
MQIPTIMTYSRLALHSSYTPMFARTLEPGNG